jgi:hypothetical protein
MHGASELIHAIADLLWPLVVIAILYIFRHKIVRLLEPAGPLRRAKVTTSGAELEWWEGEVALTATAVEAAGVVPDSAPPDLAEDLAADAERSPEVAIMEAYARVEAELRGMLQDAAVPERELSTGAARLARIAVERRLISEETASAVQGMSVLRNLAAHRSASRHGRVDVTTEQAQEYLVLADSVLYALRNPPREAP